MNLYVHIGGLQLLLVHIVGGWGSYRVAYNCWSHICSGLRRLIP